MPEITLLRAIGILLVVLGHSDIGGQKTPYIYPLVERLVYSFHMPLFMFISGFVFIYSTYNKDSFRFADFIKKKIFRLLIPSFVVLTCAFLLRAVLSYSKGNGLTSYSIFNYFKMFFLKDYLPIEFFWFIFTLFNIFLFSGLLLYSIKKKHLLILLTFIILAMNLLPLNVDMFYIKYTLSYLIYFWLGCLCCLEASQRRLMQLLYNRNASLILSIFLLILLITLNLFERSTAIENLICAVCGIFMSYSFVRYMNQFKLSYLRSIGTYSYQIFLLSWFFHRIVDTIGFQKYKLMFGVTFPLSFCLAIWGPILLAKIVEIKASKIKFAFGLQ